MYAARITQVMIIGVSAMSYVFKLSMPLWLIRRSESPKPRQNTSDTFQILSCVTGGRNYRVKVWRRDLSAAMRVFMSMWVQTSSLRKREVDAVLAGSQVSRTT